MPQHVLTLLHVSILVLCDASTRLHVGAVRRFYAYSCCGFITLVGTISPTKIWKTCVNTITLVVHARDALLSLNMT